MDITIAPSNLSGTIRAIPSKSHLHRLLICAALCEREVLFPCTETSADILATIRCLTALGAGISLTDKGIHVTPVPHGAAAASDLTTLDCGESGSTYRFLFPIAASLGRTARFVTSGRLPSRPMDDLWSALRENGAQIDSRDPAAVLVSGELSAGVYKLPGDVTSQFISGLLLALPRLNGESEIIINGEPQSAGYIKMTLDALTLFSVKVTKTQTGYIIPGGQRYTAPSEIILPEGDWSNSAFWLCAGAAGREKITVTGLNPDSSQGDRAVTEILARFGAAVEQNGGAVSVFPVLLRGIEIDAGDIPDLVPALAIAATAALGVTKIKNIARLRHKESDRITAVCQTINSLGGSASSDGETIIIHGMGSLAGGIADSYSDHRIAMLTAALAVICRDNITIKNAQAVEKSYPAFFEDFVSLGGRVTEGEIKA